MTHLSDTTINVRITERTYQWLKKQAKKQGIPMSNLASQIVHEAIPRPWVELPYTDHGSSSTMKGVSW